MNRPADDVSADETGAQGCRVLFVDDSDDLCRMMKMLLESRGHRVQTARCGEAALDLAPRFAPEAILLDLTLPDMNGCDVARKLRCLPQTRDAVLIAVSGDSHPDTLRRVRESGFHHHLLKPVDVRELEDLFPISTTVT